MKLQKIAAMLVALCMLALVACGGGDVKKDEAPTEPAATEKKEEAAPATTEKKEEAAPAATEEKKEETAPATTTPEATPETKPEAPAPKQ